MLAFWLVLWLFLSLLGGRAVNPLAVLLGAFLAAAAMALVASLFPAASALALVVVLLSGFLAALYTLAAVTKVSMLAALLAWVLALLAAALLSLLLWHSPVPPSIPRGHF